jgi:lipoate---protein ligase
VATPAASWRVELVRGSARAFHAREVHVPATRSLWWSEVDGPALVLGSTQPDSVADLDACAAAGVEVVRRRSGGGAVLLVPEEVVWGDVIIPAGDPLWHDDVGRAAWWIGEAWAEALGACGVVDLAVHRGALQTTAWSRLVCFDGVGPGELTSGGAKVLGVSQRRTRLAARFQTSLYLAYDPARLVSLLAPPRPAPGELSRVATVAADAAAVRAAFETALATRA